MSDDGKRDFSFDTECLFLAEHFLQDDAGHTNTDAFLLAQAIQDAVEAWFEVKAER